MKKTIALLLAVLMVVSLFAGCNNTPNPNENTGGSTSGNNTENTSGNSTEPPVAEGPDFDKLASMDYEDLSEELYMYHLEDYYNLVTEAKKEVDNNSKRWAALAQAEAKLLESGLLGLQTADGGNYAMSRAVPRTAPTVTWGLDEYHYGTMRAVTNLLTPAERTELVGLWSEAATADDYLAAVDAWIASKGYELRTSYDTGITAAPQTWDVLATSRAANSQYIAPGVAPLMQYDAKNELAPCLAESYDYREEAGTYTSTDEDGNPVEVETTLAIYTFHIRDGLQWVDQQGRKVADLTADDWVAGMEHMASYPQELGYLLSSDGGCGIKNWDAYIAGTITDFSEVGVKAVDDHTVEYTLAGKCPFFLSMLGYGCFMPLSRSYYTSQGGKFGAEFDPAAEDYVYGTDPSHIAYCGEYVISEFTDGSIIRYDANPTYWNADKVVMKTITYNFYDTNDVLAPFNNAKSGEWIGAGLNANALESAKTEVVEGTDASYFDTYVYVSATGSTSYTAFFNIYRQQFVNINDETKAISPQTEEQAVRTRAAMNNHHFRLALCYGTDRSVLNAATTGEELKYASLINSYVPGDLVALEEDVEVDLGNGQTQTFPAGTYYGEILQAQITADGYPIKVWDPTMNDGTGSSGGFDGWYNVANAKAELDQAIAELSTQGIEISAENPIYLDYPYYTREDYANKANAYKQALETNMDGKVIMNLIPCDTPNDWYYAGYYTDDGSQANYDIYDCSGWGPDYRDPATYLDTFLPYGTGYMTKCIGIF